MPSINFNGQMPRQIGQIDILFYPIGISQPGVEGYSGRRTCGVLTTFAA
jgi:hypothetical protein